MTELSDAMRRLIEPWTLTVTVDGETREQQFPALVDMLRAHVTPDTGKTVGGASDPALRSVVDLKSLDLLGHITDVTRAWLQEWGVTIAGELKLDLRGYWDRLTTLHRTGVLVDATHDRLAAYPDVWAINIWDLIEPPVIRPLRGCECPRCGESRWVDGDNGWTDALVVTVRQGQEVTAECTRTECAAVWVGFEDVKALGRQLGLEFDAAVMREAEEATTE